MIDGINRLRSFEAAFDYLESNWHSLGCEEDGQGLPKWSSTEVQIRNACVRSFGPFGFVKLHVECTDAIADHLVAHESELQAACERLDTGAQYTDLKKQILLGHGFADQEEPRTIRASVTRAPRPVADTDPSLGHVIAECTVPDANLDLSKITSEFAKRQLSITQHEGALSASGKDYRQAFRVLIPGGNKETAKDAMQEVFDDRYPGADVTLQSVKGADQQFQRSYDTYGNLPGNYPNNFLYAYAHLKDEVGSFASISQYYAKYGIDVEDARSRAIVRSCARVLADHTTILLCLRPLDDEIEPSKWMNVFTELTGDSDYEVRSQYAVTYEYGPWTMPKPDVRTDIGFAFQGKRLYEPGAVRGLIRGVKNCVQDYSAADGPPDVVEFDSWCPVMPSTSDNADRDDAESGVPIETPLVVSMCVRCRLREDARQDKVARALTKQLEEDNWDLRRRGGSKIHVSRIQQ
ncbi:MAG: hypothetical protein AAGH71_01115 [Planctomycetota bacterium]